jgi:hypothetical protein
MKRREFIALLEGWEPVHQQNVYQLGSEWFSRAVPCISS